jgi:hypothetical protein
VFAPVLTKPGIKVRALGGEGIMGVRARRGLSVVDHFTEIFDLKLQFSIVIFSLIHFTFFENCMIRFYLCRVDFVGRRCRERDRAKLCKTFFNHEQTCDALFVYSIGKKSWMTFYRGWLDQFMSSLSDQEIGKTDEY